MNELLVSFGNMSKWLLINDSWRREGSLAIVEREVALPLFTWMGDVPLETGMEALSLSPISGMEALGLSPFLEWQSCRHG